MKASMVVVLLATAAAAGCADGGNPNLAAPKLVLQARSDGAVTLFIHSAFGERFYEWISVSADNVTIGNRTEAFSLEETVNATGFYVDARAATQRELYTLRARLDVSLVEDEVLVSFHRDDGDWANPETFTLPFERVLNRRSLE